MLNSGFQYTRYVAKAPTLAGVGACSGYFVPLFYSQEEEVLAVAHVNDDLTLSHLSLYEGGPDCIAKRESEIMRDAALMGSKAVIIARNRREGSVRPTAADRVATARLADALEAEGVTLVDHLVFGSESKPFSYRGAALI